jgi:hypothetical protein
MSVHDCGDVGMVRESVDEADAGVVDDDDGVGAAGRDG